MVATGLLLTGGAPLEAQPQPAPSKAEEEVKAQIDGARGLAEEGRADVAVEALQKVIAASPQSVHIPAAYLLLGKILSDQKNYEEAGAYYRRLLEEYPVSDLVPQARLGLISALLRTPHVPVRYRAAAADRALRVGRRRLQTRPRRPRFPGPVPSARAGRLRRCSSGRAA